MTRSLELPVSFFPSVFIIDLLRAVAFLFPLSLSLSMGYSSGLLKSNLRNVVYSQNYHLTPLPNDKFLDWSKLKELAVDTINVTEKFKFVLGRVENIVGKGENAGYQHFLLFLQCFPKAFFFQGC